jgi:hypothetical protein
VSNSTRRSAAELEGENVLLLDPMYIIQIERSLDWSNSMAAAEVKLLVSEGTAWSGLSWLEGLEVAFGLEECVVDGLSDLREAEYQGRKGSKAISTL